MPTATSAAGYALTNLGPLTTAYTAPPSCSTAADRVQIAPATAPDRIEWATACDDDSTGWTLGGCVPSGAARDALAASPQGAGDGFLIAYHSPGTLCPVAWTTAGVAARTAGGDDGKMASSGAFAPAEDEVPGGGVLDPQLNVLMNVLDAGETAVVCCPEAWTAQPLGYCYSALPHSVFAPPTAGCERYIPLADLGTMPSSTYELYGSAITADVMVPLTAVGGRPPLPLTSTTSFPADEAAGYVGVSVLPMVAMVHSAASGPLLARGDDAGRPRRLWPVLCVMAAMAFGTAGVLPW